MAELTNLFVLWAMYYEVSLVLVLHKVMTEGKSIENNKWDFDFESNLDTVGDPLGDRCLEV